MKQRIVIDLDCPFDIDERLGELLYHGGSKKQYIVDFFESHDEAIEDNEIEILDVEVQNIEKKEVFEIPEKNDLSKVLTYGDDYSVDKAVEQIIKCIK